MAGRNDWKRGRWRRDEHDREDERGGYGAGGPGGMRTDSGRTMLGDWYRQAYDRERSGDEPQSESQRGHREWEPERRAPEDWMRYSRTEGWDRRDSAWDQGRSEWPRESRDEWGRGHGGESWARGREEWRSRAANRRDFRPDREAEPQPGYGGNYGRQDFGSYDRVEGSQGGFGRESDWGARSGGYAGGASSFGYGGGMTGPARARRGSGEPYGPGMGAASEPGPFAGRGPKGYQRSDERIREEINDRLTDHPEIDATHIDVQVKDCEVTLAGSVADRRAKRLAEDLAEQVAGVRDVRVELRIQNREAAPPVGGGPHGTAEETRGAQLPRQGGTQAGDPQDSEFRKR
jgi:hypothetical protein